MRFFTSCLALADTIKPLVAMKNVLRPSRGFGFAIALVVANLCFMGNAFGQLFWNVSGTNNSLTSSTWGTSASGPFTSPWVNSSNINFTANSSIAYVTNTPVGNLTIPNGSAVAWGATGTFSTNGAVRTFDIGTGSTLNWNSQNISTAAGTGFIKDGGGTWSMGAQGNLFPSGFTLNAGTVIIGGANALGGGALNINGGIITPNTGSARTPVVSSVTVGGNFQLGDAVNNASGTGNLIFNTSVSLGASATRVITIGGTGIYTFIGIISGVGSNLTVSAASGGTGSIVLAGNNTYSGGTTITAGTLSLGAAGVLADAGIVTLNGGTLKTGAATGFSETVGTLNLSASSTIALGTGSHTLTFAASNGVSWTGATTLTITGWAGGYNGSIGTSGRIFFWK